MSKTRLTLLLLLLGSYTATVAQSTVRKQTNNAFTFGEKLTYKVSYSNYFNLNVGEVDFEIGKKAQKVGGLSCFYMKATGRTYPFYDAIFRIRDRYESYVETQSILPMVFIRDVQEGNIKFYEHVLFNHVKGSAKSKKRTQSIPKLTQDVVSAIYYSRTLDLTNAKIGTPYYMHTFIDDTTYAMGVKYMGKSTIVTESGTYKCVKLQPILVVNKLFKTENEMSIYLTDDLNRIPVRIESGISVGTVRADLVKFSGLKNALTAKQ